MTIKIRIRMTLRGASVRLAVLAMIIASTALGAPRRGRRW